MTSTTYPDISNFSSLSETANKILQQSQEQLTCDRDCQRLKLQGELSKAERNYGFAPTNLLEAKAKYISFNDNIPYEQVLASLKEDDSQSKIKNFNSTIKNTIDNINTLFRTYQKSNESYKNVLDLHYNLNENKDDIFNFYERINDNIITTERKSYYDSQKYENLKKWYNYFLWVYIIIFIIFVIVVMIKIKNYILKILTIAIVFIISYNLYNLKSKESNIPYSTINPLRLTHRNLSII
jgi:hypothetical protein